MAAEGCVFLLLGLLISFGPQSASQRTIAIGIVLLGLVGGIRSLFAYEARLAPHEVILKSFYSTRRVPYSSIRRAERTVGQVLLYQRAYLELVRTDGTSLHFKALNEREGRPGVVERAVVAINYRVSPQ
jgi:hypothetical protein